MENITKEAFLEKGAAIMDDLASLCKEYLAGDPRKVFGFSYDEKDERYRLFIDYEALVSSIEEKKQQTP